MWEIRKYGSVRGGERFAMAKSITISSTVYYGLEQTVALFFVQQRIIHFLLYRLQFLFKNGE